ncbi:hypothetical protein QGN29_10905 [Temperatibacter marinus]|uniref:Uncharacterized protein n=1 Tax=Temperatibacter marinus TaxID=1456591 RepID=A0AA52EC37_9PROT|nr:hypothetical protein [Temperatibacter marinus]WND02056.1 hypothetical protein QGN29_10905 [Temperatibacter marinus]
MILKTFFTILVVPIVMLFAADYPVNDPLLWQYKCRTERLKDFSDIFADKSDRVNYVYIKECQSTAYLLNGPEDDFFLTFNIRQNSRGDRRAYLGLPELMEFEDIEFRFDDDPFIKFKCILVIEPACLLAEGFRVNGVINKLKTSKSMSLLIHTTTKDTFQITFKTAIAEKVKFPPLSLE